MNIYLDSAHTYQDALDKQKQWATEVVALDAQEIAGVEIKSAGPKMWNIELSFYVSEDSQEYQDFMSRFGR